MSPSIHFPAIAERTFDLVENGIHRDLRLRVGTPKARENDWVCQIQVVGIEDDHIFEIFGIDSLQALQLAVTFIGSLLKAKQEDGVEITWLGKTDLGCDLFPSFRSRPQP